MYDKETIDILVKKVELGKETDAIYALNLLESANYPQLDELLEKQLYREKAEVVSYALQRLDERGKLDTDLLHHLFTVTESGPVREKIFAVLCRLDVTFLMAMAERLSEQEFALRKIIVRNLLNQKEPWPWK
jgi:hypothetical protein